jgi:hypothetical protein
MIKRRLHLWFIAVVFSSQSLAAQSQNDQGVATLYRSSIINEIQRIHIATFDSEEKSLGGTSFDYNWENCQTAASLFEQQPSVSVTYWCEKGFND